MKNFTFRQYRRSPSNKGDPEEQQAETSADPQQNAAYLKRREQVRRAQRTHRERKEAYIKSLENEVLQLRANEAKILQESKALKFEVNRLKKILDDHGIPHVSEPQSLPSHSSAESIPSTSSLISIRQNPHQQAQLHVRGNRCGTAGESAEFYLSESDSSPPARGRRRFPFFSSREPSGSPPYGAHSTASEPGTSAADLSAFLSSSASALSLREMDQTNLGMEFVLTLEAPCLHHVQGEPHDPPLAPSGHALTASAPLLYQSYTQPVATNSSKAPQWEAPNMGLEKLLDLSSNFELEDEITPVQAWNQIRLHPGFETLEVPKLRGLTENLLKEVKCYGFGAVLNTANFENLLAQTLGQGGY